MDGKILSQEEVHEISLQAEVACAQQLQDVITSRADKYDKLEEQALLLEELGDIYLERARNDPDVLEQFTKSSALYNAALVRFNRPESAVRIQAKLYDVWSLFLHSVHVDSCPNFDEWAGERNRNKEDLLKLRHHIEYGCKDIKKVWEVYDKTTIGDVSRKDIERKVIKESQEFGALVSREMKEFFASLFATCQMTLGPPPCCYAILGLGSLSRDEMTPYSDLEFAILISEEDTAQTTHTCQIYFRRLTSLFHLMILDFGETILPAMAIHSLNDFYGTLSGRDWFYDDVTPSGLKLDAAMPWACKTPLGRKKEGKVTKDPVDLICSPSIMASYLKTDFALKEGYHLADILSCVTLISGDQKLFTDFETLSQNSLSKQGSDETRLSMSMLDLLTTCCPQRFDWGSMSKVKKQIYRFPSLAISHMKCIHSVPGKTPWEVVDQLADRDILTPDGAHNLKLLSSITYGLRMMTYAEYRAQKEDISFLPAYCSDTNRGLASQNPSEYHARYREIFLTYYRIFIPFSDHLLHGFIDGERAPYSHVEQDFLDTSQELTLEIYNKFGFHKERQLFQESMAHHPLNLDLLQNESAVTDEKDILTYCSQVINLADECWNYDHKAFVKCYEKAIHTYEHHYERVCKVERGLLSTLQYAEILCMASCIHADREDNAKTIEYGERALIVAARMEIKKKWRIIVQSKNALVLAYTSAGRYEDAIRYQVEALDELCHVPDLSSRLRPMMLQHLASVYVRTNELSSAVHVYKQCLSALKRYYGEETNHEDIAYLLYKMSNAFVKLGHSAAANELLEHAESMFTQLYQSDHPHVCRCLVLQSRIERERGNLDQARFHIQKANEMRTALDMDNLNPFFSAEILFSMSQLAICIGDYVAAFEAMEKSDELAMSVKDSVETTKRFILTNLVGMARILASALNRPREGLAKCDAALDILQKNDWIGSRTWFQTMKLKSLILVSLGELSDAKHCAEALANTTCPTEHSALEVKMLQGMIAIEDGRMEEAYQSFMEVERIMENMLETSICRPTQRHNVVLRLVSHYNKMGKAKSAGKCALWNLEQWLQASAVTNISKRFLAEAYKVSGDACFVLFDLQQAKFYYQKACELYDDTDSQMVKMEIKILVGNILLLQGSYSDAKEWLEEVSESWRNITPTGKEVEKVKCIRSWSLAQTYHILGNKEDAVAHYVAALSYVELQDKPLQWITYERLGEALLDLGNLVGALFYFLKAYRVNACESDGSREAISSDLILLFNIAKCYLGMGELNDAILFFLRSRCVFDMSTVTMPYTAACETFCSTLTGLSIAPEATVLSVVLHMHQICQTL